MNDANEELYYFDYQSTTPMDKRVIEAIYDSMREDYGNPSSAHHLGVVAEKHLREAKESFDVISEIKASRTRDSSSCPPAKRVSLE